MQLIGSGLFKPRCRLLLRMSLQPYRFCRSRRKEFRIGVRRARRVASINSEVRP